MGPTDIKTKIILDSNIFIEGSVSIESSSVSSIVSMARHLDIEIFITEGSFGEITQKNVERFEKNVSDIKKSAVLYENEICGQLEVNTIKKEEFKVAFERKFSEYITSSKINIVEFPSELPSHLELFNMAVQKKAPFNPKGNNFRDAIIALSVFGYCKKFPNEEFFFVTRDKEFIGLISEVKVKNLFACDDSKIKTVLKSRFDGESAKYFSEKQDEILAFVIENQLDELQNYCVDHANFDVEKIRFLSNEVFAIKGLNNIEVEGVEDIEYVEDAKKPFLVTLRIVGSLCVEIETSQAEKDMYMQTLSEIAGVSGFNRKPSKIGDVKIRKTVSSEVDSKRLQSGYYNKIREDRSVPVFLSVKCEIEGKNAGIEKAHFLSVTQIELARR